MRIFPGANPMRTRNTPVVCSRRRGFSCPGSSCGDSGCSADACSVFVCRHARQIAEERHSARITPFLSRPMPSRTSRCRQRNPLRSSSPSASDKIQFNSLNQKAEPRFCLTAKPVKSVISDDKAQLTTVMLKKPAKTGRHTLSFSYVRQDRNRAARPVRAGIRGAGRRQGHAAVDPV